MASAATHRDTSPLPVQPLSLNRASQAGQIVASRLPKATCNGFLKSPLNGFERRAVFLREEIRHGRIAEIGIVEVLQTLAGNAACCRGEGKACVDRRCYLSRSPKAMPHLSFEPARAKRPAVKNARTFLFQIPNLWKSRVRAVGMINIRPFVAERLGSRSETPLMRGEIKA